MLKEREEDMGEFIITGMVSRYDGKRVVREVEFKRKDGDNQLGSGKWIDDDGINRYPEKGGIPRQPLSNTTPCYV